jgi:LacI family transcriptional regulator
MVATIKDVAQRAGVSLITVSRVINDARGVHPDTRARVRAAIDELGYVPNQIARSLRSRQTSTLALLLPTIANSFWTTMARGVEDAGEERGYSVFLCNTDDDPAKEARYLDVLLSRGVEGIAVIPTLTSTVNLQRLQARKLPIVQLHRKLRDIVVDTVRADNLGATQALTERLLAAGRRRIAYLGPPRALSIGWDCLAGFEAALAAAGLEPDQQLVAIGAASERNGYALMSALLHDRPKLEALVIGNSRQANGALHALRDNGVRVPDDLPVATFYDIAALDPYVPSLITAIQPAYEIGRLGTRRLLDQITGQRQPPADILLPARVVEYPHARDWAPPALAEMA